MRYTLRFGTYFGIPVRIHFTFPLILVAFGLHAWVRGGLVDALWAVALVLAVFVCVVLHEFGHSLQVRRYGIAVRDIVLLPIGGMARAEKIPEKPWQEIVVAISGPLVNFVLALIFFGIISLRGSQAGSIADDFMEYLMGINIVLGVFNLTPAFPMDGGRILRASLATRMPYLKATRYAKNVGQVIAIIFAVIGFVNTGWIMLALVAVFVFFGATMEERMLRVKVLLEGKSARDFLAEQAVMLAVEDSVETALRLIDNEERFAFAVTDRTGTLAGAVEARDIRQAVTEGKLNEPLDRIVKTGFPLIEGSTPAIQTYYLLRSHKVPLAGIIHDNVFLGLVLYKDIAKKIG
jgi:stage IV sporulation protein FB